MIQMLIQQLLKEVPQLVLRANGPYILQIELANNVFSPPEAEVTKAKRILEELEKAAKEGKGAAQLDGRMIDAASARMAENIVNIDKLLHNK